MAITPDFRQSDFALRTALTGELHANLEARLVGRDGWVAIAGTVVDAASAAKAAVALAFGSTEGAALRIVVVDIDRATQRRSGPVRSLTVDPEQPIEEDALSFEELLKLIALSDPRSDSVREMGPVQFSLISNSEEEPDLSRVLR